MPYILGSTLDRQSRQAIAAAEQQRARYLGFLLLPSNYYTTVFSLTENPMSEGDVWQQGAALGLDWANVRTTTNKAFGTETGTNTTTTIGVTPNKFDDSSAILRGNFGADQMATAVVFNNDTAASDHQREVELRLRAKVSPHSLSGYEIEFSADPANPYFDIVRWNGQVGDFTPLGLSTGGTHLGSMPGGAAVTGDVLLATIIGSTISGYKNGVLMATATDTTFTNGNPGMGFFLHNGTQTGDPTTYGFTSYTAMTLGTPPSNDYPGIFDVALTR